MRLDDGAGRRVEPVVTACQQKPQCGPSRECWDGRTFGVLERSHLGIRLKQRPAFGDIEGEVFFETPGVEADGEVVS